MPCDSEKQFIYQIYKQGDFSLLKSSNGAKIGEYIGKQIDDETISIQLDPLFLQDNETKAEIKISIYKEGSWCEKSRDFRLLGPLKTERIGSASCRVTSFETYLKF
jgi:hypothetical protein